MVPSIPNEIRQKVGMLSCTNRILSLDLSLTKPNFEVLIPILDLDEKFFVMVYNMPRFGNILKIVFYEINCQFKFVSFCMHD